MYLVNRLSKAKQPIMVFSKIQQLQLVILHAQYHH